MPFTPPQRKELVVHRWQLTIAALVSAIWWGLVELFLPGSFNPFPSRMAVVALILVALAFTFTSHPLARHPRWLVYAATWAITLHYFYLFHGNSADANWTIGACVTVMAINFCYLSNGALLAYSVFVLALSAGLTLLHPALTHTIFLPGIVTIVFQANVGLRTRLRTMQNLAESQRRFALLLNSTFEGILVHEGRQILVANQALADMLGYSRAELEGKDMLHFVHPEEQTMAAARIQAATAEPIELKAITRDGFTIEVEVRAKDFLYENRRARLVNLQRIDDRKKAERQRLRAQSMEENVRVRDEFISIASHELKTPITSLKLRAQMLDRNLQQANQATTNTAKVREFLEITGKQIHRLTELVEAMLDVSRISLGKLALNPQPLDLANLVQETIALFRTQIPNATYPISWAGPSALTICGDASRLGQVIENLLSNAMKYGRDRPIRVTLETKAGEALLTVADEGVGIAEENLKRVFERFERVSSTENVSGLGLGLYISRQIVEAHGGNITIASEPGVYSAFTVHLPL